MLHAKEPSHFSACGIKKLGMILGTRLTHTHIVIRINYIECFHERSPPVLKELHTVLAVETTNIGEIGRGQEDIASWKK